MSERWHWDHYWHSDRIASCFDGAGASNYDDIVAAGWRDFLSSLPSEAALLDLCTGNGAVALIAAQMRSRGYHFAVTGVDQAAIEPARYVSRLAPELERIRFLGGVAAEDIPFERASFDAVLSQYGIEYTDVDASLGEIARVLRAGGAARLVMHAAEGIVVKDSRIHIKDADYLLDELELPLKAMRCFEAVTAVERNPAAATADRELARQSADQFAEALRRGAEYVRLAADKDMVRNCVSVLYDTYSKRGELGELLAKATEVRNGVEAHRARLRH